ncbi:MAG: penicillin-binding protein 1A [Pseudomonadales bacterium]
MQKQIRRFSYLLFWLLFTLVSGTAVTAAGVYLYLSPNLPDVDDLYEVKLQIPLRIYSYEGELLGEFGEKRRTPVTYDQVPDQFVRAILAAEDSHFETHSGVAIRGLLRATIELLLTGEKQTGGSTITMQVARNFFLSREQTFTRKFNEILLALEIERKLTKEQIFELYVNKIFWGNRAYGVEAAAQVYYGKSVGELNLAQMAMIAGLPKAPSSFNPIVNPERAITRRNWILRRMLDLNYIKDQDYRTAVDSPISAELHGSKAEVDAPYAAELARLELLELFGREAYDSGLNVYTSIKSKLQTAANDAVRSGILDYDQRHGYRGPEGHSFDADKPELNMVNWLAALQDKRTINGLLPAVVLDVQDQHLEILLAENVTARIEFENGLQQARRFIDENTLDAEVESAKSVAQVGDLIRVYAIDDQGKLLAELPRQQAAEHNMVNAPTIDSTSTEQDSDLESAGDSVLQTATHQATTYTWHFAQLPRVQSSLISVDPNDGAIQAVVGGFDFYSSKFNRATQGERQPGSNFKPFIYAAALDKGFTAASLFNDAPVVMRDAELENTWRPENASGKFYGPTRLRKALYLSRNLVSVRLLRTITPQSAINYVQAFGFDAERLPKDLSLSLGSHAVTPLEVARGYAVFANGGYLVEPHIIQRIENGDGTVLFRANPKIANCLKCPDPDEEPLAGQQTPEEEAMAESQPVEPNQDIESSNVAPESEPQMASATPLEQLLSNDLGDDLPDPIAAPRVIEERIAYIMDNFLKDVIRRGTGIKARELNRADIAGKTGTTNGPVDAWFSGYNPDLITTVWLGFDQNQFLGKREYGGSASLPIWIDYMRTALEGKPEVLRRRPNGLTSVRIDPESGLLASPLQDNAIFEMFRVENAPLERAPDPVGYELDNEGGDGIEGEPTPYGASESDSLEELF